MQRFLPLRENKPISFSNSRIWYLQQYRRGHSVLIPERGCSVWGPRPEQPGWHWEPVEMSAVHTQPCLDWSQEVACQPASGSFWGWLLRCKGQFICSGCIYFFQRRKGRNALSLLPDPLIEWSVIDFKSCYVFIGLMPFNVGVTIILGKSPLDSKTSFCGEKSKRPSSCFARSLESPEPLPTNTLLWKSLLSPTRPGRHLRSHLLTRVSMAVRIALECGD